VLLRLAFNDLRTNDSMAGICCMTTLIQLIKTPV
jgi:hypothetical protein